MLGNTKLENTPIVSYLCICFDQRKPCNTTLFIKKEERMHMATSQHSRQAGQKSFCFLPVSAVTSIGVKGPPMSIGASSILTSGKDVCAF